MPLITLTMQAGRNAAQKKALLDGVHNALVSSFGIPENDRLQFINEVAPDNWDMEQTPYEIIVEVKAFAGRSRETKRTLYKNIVENLSDCNLAPESVFIIVNDIPTENWGLRGGQAGCDIDFGFQIDV